MKKDEFLKLGVSEDLAAKCESASAEELKGYIPMTRFNEVNEENKSLKVTIAERDTQLADLKKSNSDNDALKKQIAALEAANAEQKTAHEAEMNRLRLDNAIETELISAGAKNVRAVRALLNTDNVKLDGDKLLGLNEQLETLRKSDGYLFAEKEARQNFTGFQPGASGDGLPKADVDLSGMTYSQMIEYEAKNPGVKFE